MKKAVLINDTSTKPHIGCRIVVANAIRMAADVGFRMTATASVHTDWRRHDELKQEMREADIVIVNGEGTMHDSVSAARVLAAVGPFCRDAQVPAVLINSVYQDNDASIAEDCRAFERIFVRESASAEFARRQGLRVDVVPDLTLTSDLMQRFAGARRSDRIVMTDNANLPLSVSTIDFGVRLPEVVFLNLDTHDPQPTFVPPSLRPGRTFLDSGAVDQPEHRHRTGWTRALKAGLSNLSDPIRRGRAARNLRRSRPASEILREIATCRALVAGRFHAMCLALLADTPFAALPSNTLKTKGLLTDAGLAGRLVATPAEAYGLARNWSDVERDLAARFVARARTEGAAMFREIAALAR
jgi:hypothetical protein